ncbi:MAG: J domain-containing protein [Myxococcales bacterium]|nr:J domain-containing protein [Myxococcales bacterium]
MADFNPAIDYYAILGVAPNAGERAIKAAYRQLAARYHPDRHRGHDLEDLATEKLAQLNEAFRVLSDPALRSAYDLARANTGHGHGDAPRPYAHPTGIPTQAPSALLRQILYVILGFVSLWLSARTGPRQALIVLLIFAAGWFAPRILNRLRRK